VAVIRIDACGLVVLAVIAAGMIAGCGGGDDPNSSAPSKREFANNADKICADVSRQVSELSRAKPRSVPALMRFIDQLKRAVSDEINRLQALEKPTGDAGRKAEQFTDTLEGEYKQDVLPALNQLQNAVSDHNNKALRAASKKLEAAQSQASRRLASELGASQCAAS
jgi:hypothetical protein